MYFEIHITLSQKITKITNRKLIKLLNLYLSIPGQEKSMRTSNISFCVQIIILLSQIFRMDVETFFKLLYIKLPKDMFYLSVTERQFFKLRILPCWSHYKPYHRFFIYYHIVDNFRYEIDISICHFIF